MLLILPRPYAREDFLRPGEKFEKGVLTDLVNGGMVRGKGGTA